MLATKVELLQPCAFFQFTARNGVEVGVKISCEFIIDECFKVLRHETNHRERCPRRDK